MQAYGWPRCAGTRRCRPAVEPEGAELVREPNKRLARGINRAPVWYRLTPPHPLSQKIQRKQEIVI